MTSSMLPSPFRALARGIVPETADLDETGWLRLEGIIEENLADRPEKLRNQLSLFIKVAGFLPRLRYGRSIESLCGPSGKPRSSSNAKWRVSHG